MEKILSDNYEKFKKELEKLLNQFSMENASDTPDYILAEYLMDCLIAFNANTKRREHWYGRNISVESGKQPFTEEPPKSVEEIAGEFLRQALQLNRQYANAEFLVGKQPLVTAEQLLEDSDLPFGTYKKVKQYLANITNKVPKINRFEEIADGLIKLAYDYRWNALCARATIFPGKSIYDVQEILKSHTAEYLLDNNYPQMLDVVKESVRQFIRKKEGNPLVNPDDWEIVMIETHGCPCGHNGKTLSRDSIITGVRVEKRIIRIGDYRKHINENDSHLYLILGFVMQNNRVFAKTTSRLSDKIGILIDIVNLI